MAFKIAGSMAFKKAARAGQAGAARADHEVEVVTPEDYMGDVIGDLSSRRGKVEGMEQRGHLARRASRKCRSPRCSATLPTFVRAPRGAPTYTMQFDSYQQVPESIAQEITARVRGE